MTSPTSPDPTAPDLEAPGPTSPGPTEAGADAETRAVLQGVGAVFDHVCVAAPSLAGLLPLYRDVLGGRFLYGELNRRVGFRVVTLGFPERTKIELMEPAPGSTFLDSFLARTGGGGLHHVTFRVPDLRGALAAVQAAGYAVFGEHLDDPVWSEAFLHPRDASGVLLQLAELGPRWRDAVGGRTLEDVLAAR